MHLNTPRVATTNIIEENNGSPIDTRISRTHSYIRHALSLCAASAGRIKKIRTSIKYKTNKNK